ncbi:integrase [Sinorhizobium terangae]|uniref:Tyrosine-type recombinase/integrase n=1 Tax=Sinorhizobium terangae TaxID=110322 RepID=A0A6N7LFI2_SINTE|nr:tyrosine-type recombinase/integrase [Sinorhizobium terangae]MBB4189824.1 integrase [Sinorhizobium terangae]MQX15821.1 tyrosine-type recombinase/integrase [Sinorhizobium terangae]MQX16613.1 tyrosine-type recombinase/integrase [Sinorhizobium terangae]MQX19265.1 tyrosine-type recombinase/integrase [Sinorhizobium terangae]
MSALRQAAHDYIEMRRGLGFKLREAGRGLIDFVSFLEANDAPYITMELALEWAQRPSHTQPSHWAARLGYVRGFARHWVATDPRTQIPPDGLLPFRPKRALPYLYSHADIRRLLSAALEMPCRYTCCKLRPLTFYCLFGLLSVAGLRLGEARNLKLSDIDFDAMVLTIRGTKFGKSRLVPMHASTCAVLQDLIKRRQRHNSALAASPYLFTSYRGNRLDVGDIHRTFYALSRRIGLRGIDDSHGPRLHDMRHVFATNTLLRWYQAEQDPERLLPILSTYLGHAHVADTQWYLSASPELMTEAMRRLERRWEDRT